MLLSSKNRFRIAATAALILGAAVNANAWIITFSGPNTGGVIGLTYEFSDLLTGPFVVAVAGTPTVGTASFTSGTQSLLVSYAGTSVTSGGTFSTDGTWTLLAETNLPNILPLGTESSSFDNILTNGVYEWSFVGTATPEPAPFAAMGIGIIGLCVSRRRKLRS